MKKIALGCAVCLGAIAIMSVVFTLFSNIPKDNLNIDQTTSETTISETSVPPPILTQPSQPKDTSVTSLPPPTFTQTSQPKDTSLISLPVDQAQSLGLIEYKATGRLRLNTFDITVSSKMDNNLKITILRGTVFNPQTSDICRMAVVTDNVINLAPGQQGKQASIGAVCLDMNKPLPGFSDRLTADSAFDSQITKNLIDLPDFHAASFRVQQFAIWTLAENPKINEYVGIRISSSGGYTTMGDGPSENEIEIIRTLFAKINASVEDFQALTTPVYLELIEGAKQGFILVTARGMGSLEKILLDITSRSDDILKISVLPGTIFESQDPNIQSMVVYIQKIIVVNPYETVKSIEIDAACASMRRGMPDTDNALILTELASGDLIKLLKLPDFKEQTYRVQQFAIWIITDNPKRNEFIGIGFFGVGTGPSNDEMVKIKILFESAGISTQSYQAFA